MSHQLELNGKISYGKIQFGQIPRQPFKEVGDKMWLFS